MDREGLDNIDMLRILLTKRQMQQIKRMAQEGVAIK